MIWVITGHESYVYFKFLAEQPQNLRSELDSPVQDDVLGDAITLEYMFKKDHFHGGRPVSKINLQAMRIVVKLWELVRSMTKSTDMWVQGLCGKWLKKRVFLWSVRT